MKKILILLMGLILLSACGSKDSSKEGKEVTKEESYKSVRVEKVKKKQLLRNDISSGIIDPVNEVSQLTDTGGDVAKINFKNGDRVEKGGVILVLKDQDVHSAHLREEANYLSARSDYETKSINYKKFEKLYQEELISEDEYLNVKNQLNQSFSNLKRAEASYLSAKENYDNLTMKAKISGIVTDMDHKLYEKIEAKTRVFTVIDDSIMRIKTGVAGEEINNLQVGGRADISPENTGEKYQGKVYEINPVADPETKKYEVKIELNNRDSKLKKGMYSRVVLETGEKIGYLVPKQAIVVKDLYSYIFVVAGEVAKEIKVDRGYSQGNYQEVVSKLLPETFKVVVEGQFLLEDNNKVRVLN